MKIGNIKTQIIKVTEAEFFLKSAAYPETDKPEKRLLSVLKDLVDLMSIKIDQILLVDSSKLQYFKYGLGDAYGGVFGVTTKGESVLDIETGTWNALGSQQFSNFREIIVYKIAKDAKEGKLSDIETSMFTDNTTAESAYQTGTSSSP